MGYFPSKIKIHSFIHFSSPSHLKMQVAPDIVKGSKYSYEIVCILWKFPDSNPQPDDVADQPP